jgi:hypothetical protein
MRTLTVAVAALLLSAPSVLAQPPADLIVGEWQCTAQMADIVHMAGPITYRPDGTMTAQQVLSGGMQGQQLLIELSARGVWEIDADGKLAERLLEASAPSGSIGKEGLPEEVLADFERAVVANSLSVSDFTVTEAELHISDGEGGGTFCGR